MKRAGILWAFLPPLMVLLLLGICIGTALPNLSLLPYYIAAILLALVFTLFFSLPILRSWHQSEMPPTLKRPPFTTKGKVIQFVPRKDKDTKSKQ